MMKASCQQTAPNNGGQHDNCDTHELTPSPEAKGVNIAPFEGRALVFYFYASGSRGPCRLKPLCEGLMLDPRRSKVQAGEPGARNTSLRRLRVLRRFNEVGGLDLGCYPREHPKMLRLAGKCCTLRGRNAYRIFGDFVIDGRDPPKLFGL